MTPKDREFWRRIEHRREKLQEAIRIKREEVAEAVMPPPGSPPFAYRQAFEAAGSRPVSRAEHEEARRLFLARIAVHRAEDEPPEDLLGKIGRGPYVRPAAKSEEYALGVWALEQQDAHTRTAHIRAGLLLQYIAAPGPDSFSVHDLTFCGFSLAEIAILSAFLRSQRPSGMGLQPGRLRGRPPKGERARANTERSRLHRAKEKA